MATEKLIVELEAKTGKLDSSLKKTSKNFDDLNKDVKSTDKSLDDFDGSSEKTNTSLISMNKSLVAAGVAFAVLSNETRKAVALADEYNVSTARTEAILKATGNAAGFSAEQLREQADALALSTLTSTKDVQEAQAALLTFNRVAGDTFTETIQLSQDLAELGFGSIQSASVQLGKALQDPITGISALTRVGVSFNDVQKEQIQLMVESGKQAEAQRIILDALQSQVGGAGAAVAEDSLAGKLDTAGQRWDEFTSNLANKTGALDAAKESTSLFTEAIEALNQSLTGGTLDEQLATVNAQIAQQQAAVDGLVKSKNDLEAVDLKSLGSSQALAVINSNKILNAKELATAEAVLAKSIQERDSIEEQVAAKETARLEAKRAGEEKQAQLDAEAAQGRADEQIRIQTETAEKQAEIDAQVAQRKQEAIDAEAVRIQELYLSQEEQQRLAAERQTEIIDQSNLDEMEKVDARFAIWEAYYADLDRLRGDDVKSAQTSSRQEQQIGQQTLRAANAINTAFLDDNKAVRSALVVADTAAGVTRQFSDLPYPAALASSASIIALGAAQLATINSSGRGSSNISSSAPSAPPSTPPQEEVAPPQDIVASAGDVSGTNQDIVIRFEGNGDDITEAIANNIKVMQVSGVLE